MKRRMLMLLAVWPGLSFSVQAVTPALGLSCITEGQYDMKRSLNLVTLLRLDGSLTFGRGSLEAATIHILKTASEPLAADWQAFSNIEEENMPAGIAVAGYRYGVGNMSFFAGVRNMNEDYFASPVTAFFTNSSCGIFPVLSANYPIANYPMSGLCLDYRLKAGNWEFESSLYNGVAHPGNRLDRIFRFRPRRDGVFSISSLNYNTHGGSYFGGFYLYRSVCGHDDMGEQIGPAHETSVKEMNTGCWVYAEQPLYVRGDKKIEMLLQYAADFSPHADCRRYGAGGFLISGFLLPSCNDRFGMVMTGARYAAGLEKALELTWAAELGPHLAIQPAFHFISNPEGEYTIATCRVLITF